MISKAEKQVQIPILFRNMKKQSKLHLKTHSGNPVTWIWQPQKFGTILIPFPIPQNICIAFEIMFLEHIFYEKYLFGTHSCRSGNPGGRIWQPCWPDSFVYVSILFLDPKNMDLDSKSIFLGQLVPKLLPFQNPFTWIWQP